MLHLAVKAAAGTAVQLLPDIGLVEVGDLDDPGLIRGAELHKFKPPADPLQLRLIRYDGGDTRRLSRPCLRDGKDSAAVVIATGKIGDEVENRAYSESVQRLGALVSDPADAADVIVELCHGLLRELQRVG